MMLSRLWISALLAVLAWFAGAPARAALVFQPEVLLMRSVRDGAEKSFSHAKLKPVEMAGQPASGVFRYRAENDTVTCTVRPAPPNAEGTVVTTIEIQREVTDAGGAKNLTRTSQQFLFRPGKSLIVATAPHARENLLETTVEILQLTLAK